ncbi:hypothetical protein GCM10023175_63530 [Pseudonocardia xishanensis]|uniref:Uncharacterized protein n=1 Tax=Pseudonocardia xishanensis TaxID=630995 RepID=A0ABP8S3L1_9PSEU
MLLGHPPRVLRHLGTPLQLADQRIDLVPRVTAPDHLEVAGTVHRIGIDCHTESVTVSAGDLHRGRRAGETVRRVTTV